MDGEPAWMAELEDEEPPEDEGEYWEDDELTPEELSAWFGAGPGVPEPEPGPELSAEGNVPDLIAAVLGAAGDPALMSDADLVDSMAGWHAVAARAIARELRSTEELLRRRRPRVWDRRADRAEGRREELDGDQGVEVPERGMPAVV